MAAKERAREMMPLVMDASSSSHGKGEKTRE